MNSLRMKMGLSYMLLSAVLVTLITVVNYHTYMKGLKESMSLTLLDTTRQLVLNMDQYLGEIIKMSSQPLLDNKIQDTLYGNTDYAVWQQRQIIEKYLDESILFSNPEFASVYVKTTDGLSISRLSRMSSIQERDIAASIWYDQAVSKAGSYVLSNAAFLPARNDEKIPGFSVYRQLNHTYTGKPYAMVAIDVPLQTLDYLMLSFSAGNHLSVSIVGNDGSLVYGDRKEQIGLPYVPFDQNSWISSQASLSQYGWSVVASMPIAAISDESVWIRNSLLTTAGFSVFTALLLSIGFSRQILQPLLRLKKIMKRAEQGQFQLRFITRSQDEIGQLGNSFNHMMSQIEDLISKVYMAQILQQEAEFAALQSQIKPHFLFNSLESIRMMAEIEKNVNVSRMIASLGKLLKEAIQTKKITTFRQELDYVENYLYLQKYRLSHPLETKLWCDPQVLSMELPPLLIQPLVENSILHGIRPLAYNGILNVTISLLPGERIQIEIWDNGVGMPAARLADLLQAIENPQPPERFGIGVWNVRQRLVHKYGAAASFHMLSAEGAGTRITIELPGNETEQASAAEQKGASTWGI